MMKRMIPKNRLGRFFGSKVYQPQKDYGPVYHEYQKYKEITHKARQHNKKLYGEKQEQIDLEWINEYEEDQYRIMVDRAMKARTNAAIFSFQEADYRRVRREREEERATLMRDILVETEIKKANKSRILKTLELDSTNWFTPNNLDKKLSETVVVPDVVESQSDYYRRLQDIVLSYETGSMEEMDEKIYQKDAIRFKNSILVPLFTRVKGLAAFLNKDDEKKLLEEYETARALILSNVDYLDSDEKLQKLDQIYNGLILSLRKELKKPGNLVNHLHERFLIFYNLLKLWKQYTHYLRMGSDEIISYVSSQTSQVGTNERDDADNTLYYTSDAEIGLEDATIDLQEADFDVQSIRNDMMKDFENENDGASSTGQRVVDNDSEFDSELKSIDDTMLNTSDYESSSLAGVQIEDNIDWSELDEALNDTNLEEEFSQLPQEQQLYGEFSKSNAERVDQLLLKLEIERIIPKSVAEKTLDFNSPILENPSVEDIRDEYEINKSTDLSTLNSSIFVEVALQKLDSIDRNTLNSKDKRKLDDLLFLLERIGNIKVNEPDMLLKIIENC